MAILFWCILPFDEITCEVNILKRDLLSYLFYKMNELGIIYGLTINLNVQDSCNLYLLFSRSLLFLYHYWWCLVYCIFIRNVALRAKDKFPQRQIKFNSTQPPSFSEWIPGILWFFVTDQHCLYRATGSSNANATVILQIPLLFVFCKMCKGLCNK